MEEQELQEKPGIEEIETVEEEQKKHVTFKSAVKDYIFLLLIAGTLFALDQYTKGLVVENIPFGDRWMPIEWLSPYVQIVNWKNTGAAFGMFQNGGTLFMYVAIIVSIMILYYFPQIPNEEWPLRIALSMQMGGALGNLTDRLNYGHVVDFVAVGNFPVFNVADSSIFMGVVILVIGVWIVERREKAERKEMEQIPSD